MESEEKCKFCGTNIKNTRYYKMATEYPRVERLGDTENASLIEFVYPERRENRYLAPNAKNSRDFTAEIWTRDENIMWNYKNGFDYNLMQRDKLRYLYSMVTIEHYFQQQHDQVVSYSYRVNENKQKEISGNIHIRRKLEDNESPYGMEVRQTPWNKLVWPQTVDNWPLSLGPCEDKSSKVVEEESDIDFEYFSDVESEYSD